MNAYPQYTWASARQGQDYLSRAIVVLGVARSGTSAVAGALHHLGVRMCEQERRGDANPTGTFEDAQFLWRGLQLQASRWHFVPEAVRGYADAIRERNHRFAVWGMKEPRFMLCLRAFLPIFEDVRFVAVRRSPQATEASYERWKAKIDGPSLEEQRAAMEDCQQVAAQIGVSVLTMWYEALLEDAAGQVGKLAEWAFDGLDVRADPEHVARAIAFVDPRLRHF